MQKAQKKDIIDLKILYKKQQRIFTVLPHIKSTQLKKSISSIFKIPTSQLSISFINTKKQLISLPDEEISIKDIGIDGQQILIVKNLGKQIGWSTVFYIEYLGPIVIIPIMYFMGNKNKYQLNQHLAAAMGILHFVKREFQTKFIHVFSKDTMPFKRVFINCFHYWFLFAILTSMEMFIYPRDVRYNQKLTIILLIIWIIMQICNYKCHKQLSNFRKSSKSNRGIPTKCGFSYISSANYFWQILSWISYSILTKSYTSVLFTTVSTIQMIKWAIKKHKRYIREYKQKYPKNRKAIFPYII